MDMMGTATSSFWEHLDVIDNPSHVSPEAAEAFLGDIMQNGNLMPPGLVSRPGGSAINVAVSCKELGLSAIAVACVGNDKKGQEIRDSLLIKEIPLFGRTIEQSTGVFISVSPPPNSGLPNIPIVVVSPAAARAIRGIDNFEDFLADGWHLHIDGLLIDEYPWLVQLAVEARVKKMRISIDASTAYVAKKYSDELTEFACAYCDYIFFNEKEYAAIRRHHIETLIDGGCVLVIKLGSRGARYISRNLTVESNTEPLDIPLDIGAGDAFAAGFLKASIHEASPQEMLGAGNSTASAYLKKLNHLR
jgi:sugar/nucleoside kinase (ribokinase family)